MQVFVVDLTMRNADDGKIKTSIEGVFSSSAKAREHIDNECDRLVAHTDALRRSSLSAPRWRFGRGMLTSANGSTWTYKLREMAIDATRIR